MKLLLPVLLSMTGLSASAPSAQKGAPSADAFAARQDFTFEFAHSPSTPTRSVYVMGELDELGGNDLRHAIELNREEGDTWRVTISVPVGREFTYAYYDRSRASQALHDRSNGFALTGELTGRTRTPLVGKRKKSLFFVSSLPRPVLHWRITGGPFAALALEEHGPGRATGERTWVARRFGEAGRRVEFFFADANEGRRLPLEDRYSTELDRFLVQDGALYTYVPAPVVSPVRNAGVSTLFSNALQQERSYRVVLPRGYDEHTDRSYPVMYLYDGSLMWDAGAVSWDPGAGRMASLVDGGEAGEVIQVAVDFLPGANNCEITTNRGRDCLPPEVLLTGPCGAFHGEADLFLTFVTDELKPLIDATYRTRPERESTFAVGFSFGGVYALYAGWDHSKTFGAVAPQSGALWVPSFPARVMAEPRRDVRIYLDAGTFEGAVFETTRNMVSALQAKGYVLSDDLQYRMGLRQQHTYVAGGTRMRSLMSFLYPATAEPVRLPALR